MIGNFLKKVFGTQNERTLDRIRPTVDRVNALALADKPPHHLSGGQKSAVAIATVIAMEPDILAMDEPAASLDPKSRRAVIGLLDTFTHSKIVASHDLDLILDVCARCLVIRDGAIVADGPAAEILSDATLLAENNLELPLTLQGRPTKGRMRP